MLPQVLIGFSATTYHSPFECKCFTDSLVYERACICEYSRLGECVICAGYVLNLLAMYVCVCINSEAAHWFVSWGGGSIQAVGGRRVGEGG